MSDETTTEYRAVRSAPEYHREGDVIHAALCPACGDKTWVRADPMFSVALDVDCRQCETRMLAGRYEMSVLATEGPCSCDGVVSRCDRCPNEVPDVG